MWKRTCEYNRRVEDGKHVSLEGLVKQVNSEWRKTKDRVEEGLLL